MQQEEIVIQAFNINSQRGQKPNPTGPDSALQHSAISPNMIKDYMP